ncbi:MAG: LD-carboxypeptidase [Chlorobium phaeobacteroides]|uniref:Muramoyltetrapeptide carboxypeptidase n=1 Tax=Chlorobium phaeobacteroides (strain BS1) TaxID=331678 RepID=B3EJK7_CHLPB|nr:LD-carboxypeptidase [Chlorobium phaeobacteroides]
MRTLIPKALRHGDTIGLISPSSPSPDHEKVGHAVSYLEKLGYRVKPAEHFNSRTENRLELDRRKLSDLHEMFADTSVKAIFCLRGGSGATRLLQDLDYELVSRNPKILAGYSDITALSIGLFAKTGLLTFSGPMLATELHNPSGYTEENFWKILESTSSVHQIINHPDHPINVYREGSATGTLLAGNLTVLSCLVGTPYLPPLDGTLPIFEDINEEPYRIDRLLSHFHNAGLLSSCSGILFGQFSKEIITFDTQHPLLDILRYYTEKTSPNVPVVAGLSYGHIDDLLTLPVGATCTLNASHERISLTTSPAVCSDQ